MYGPFVTLDIPALDDPIAALPRTIAIRRLINTLLADKAANMASYVGTAAVARDMLSILEALGQGSLVEVGSCVKLIQTIYTDAGV